MATLDTVVDYLQDQATSALTTARETASRISGNFIPSVGNIDFDYEVNKPVLNPPPQFSDMFPGADTSSELVQFLNDQADQWVAKYFPAISGCLKTVPEDLLCSIISGQKPLGNVDAQGKTIFDIVWERARSRAYKAGSTETQTLYAEFSERGFSLPPGQLIQLRAESEQRASQAIAEVNREQLIQEETIRLDLLKFAEEQAIRLKIGVLGAMANFYQIWNTTPDKDIDRARVRAQAYASFYSALSSYYNVEVSFEELRLRAEQIDAGTELDVERLKVEAFSANQGQNALGNAVRAFGDVSAAASNAQSALIANITSGTGA